VLGKSFIAHAGSVATVTHLHLVPFSQLMVCPCEVHPDWLKQLVRAAEALSGDWDCCVNVATASVSTAPATNREKNITFFLVLVIYSQ
jgi:hypothetical protein